MNVISFQKKNGIPVPFLPEDQEKWDEYKENQITKHKVSGYRKQRSWQQLKLLHVCLIKVSENTDLRYWNTLKKAKHSLKVELHYIDPSATIVDRQGNIHFKYRSFGYDDLAHMDACKLFDRAWPILAEVIGVSVEELLAEAENDED